VGGAGAREPDEKFNREGDEEVQDHVLMTHDATNIYSYTLPNSALTLYHIVKSNFIRRTAINMQTSIHPQTTLPFPPSMMMIVR
jgi:hypothetical protein